MLNGERVVASGRGPLGSHENETHADDFTRDNNTAKRHAPDMRRQQPKLHGLHRQSPHFPFIVARALQNKNEIEKKKYIRCKEQMIQKLK